MSKKIAKIFDQGTSTIVCVTDQFNCERIIEAGREISNKSKTPLYVISAVNVTKNKSTHADVSALEHLFKISKQNNAVMTISYSDNPMQTIAEFIKSHNGRNILTGLPNDKNSALNYLWKSFPKSNFYVVDKDGEIITNKQLFVSK